MALNRDLSILIVEAEARRKGREIDVADALAGTGARSIRLAREVQASIVVHANDAMPQAVAALRENARMNDVPCLDAAPPHAQGGPNPVVVHETDAHAFLAHMRFDVVDLDPCGSPMPFLDAVMRSVRSGGLVCVTATDTGALAGTFPRVCKRRYDAHHGLHGEAYRAEVGLRILAGAVIRSAARFERVATPVLAISHGHWMRVVCRVEDGRRDADVGLKGLAYAVPAERGATWVTKAPHDGAWAGPMWTGPLHDAALLAGMREATSDKSLRPATLRLLDVLQDEADAPAFFMLPDRLQNELGPPPRRDELVARIRQLGGRASRTHLDPQGVRTDAPMELLEQAWRATP